MLQPPDLRQPRMRVLVNGVETAGALRAEITSNNHYAADRFRLDMQTNTTGANTWSAIDQAQIEIQLSLDGVGYASVIHGDIDQLRIDPRALRVTLEGRDFTSRFIQARTQETFANQTSSQIAAILAARRGLSAKVTATTTPVGAYWQLEHDRTTLDSFSRTVSEWDLLITLASHEGFDVFVSSTTLYFQPPVISTPQTIVLSQQPTLNGPANLMSLSMERSLTLAGNIAVTVRSWNSRLAQSFVQTVTSSGTASPSQTFVYVVPNLTPDAALRLAQSRLAELTSHERVIEADMPGELTLMPRQQIMLAGTKTAFDQLYWIDEVTRRLDVQSGFTQSLRARNSSVLANSIGE